MSIIRTILTRGLPALIILGFFVLVYNYLQATKQVVKPQAPEEQVWTVKSVTAQQADARPLEQAFGTVVAAREAHLRFGVAGEVAQVSDKLRNGADVSTGDVLARLDTERLQLALDTVDVQIEAETNQIKEFTSQLALRQRMAERARSLFDKSVGSQAEVDAAELAVSQASNQLAMAKARLAELKVSQRRHRKDLEDAVLKAPFNGSLSGVDLALGNQVSNTYLVATLTDLSSLEVSFVVAADIYANVNSLIGQPVTLRWSSEGSVYCQSSGRRPALRSLSVKLRVICLASSWLIIVTGSSLCRESVPRPGPRFATRCPSVSSYFDNQNPSVIATLRCVSSG